MLKPKGNPNKYLLTDFNVHTQRKADRIFNNNVTLMRTKDHRSFLTGGTNLQRRVSRHFKYNPPARTLMKIGGGIALGATLLKGISSISKDLKRGPVVHVSKVKSPGSIQNYGLGPDPFAGVKFARRRRTYMLR